MKVSLDFLGIIHSHAKLIEDPQGYLGTHTKDDNKIGGNP